VIHLESFGNQATGGCRQFLVERQQRSSIGYVLKADIRHYFDTVDRQILMGLIKRKVKDRLVLKLIQKILDNHITRYPKRGMPIGNLTSQFVANLYLNELDYFIKHKLKAKFYVRYVDDFVILHESKDKLELWKREIEHFLKILKLEIHPEKSNVFPFHKGTKLLGYRVFYHYKLLKRSNIQTVTRRLEEFKQLYEEGDISREKIMRSIQSWMAYAKHASSYKTRRGITKQLNSFGTEKE